MTPHPLCSCHGLKACVHQSNYRPDPDGEDRERGWNWHCLIKGCEGYSLLWVILPEWLEEMKAEWRAYEKEKEKDPAPSPEELGRLIERLRESRAEAEAQARDRVH